MKNPNNSVLVPVSLAAELRRVAERYKTQAHPIAGAMKTAADKVEELSGTRHLTR